MLTINICAIFSKFGICHRHMVNWRRRQRRKIDIYSTSISNNTHTMSNILRTIQI